MRRRCSLPGLWLSSSLLAATLLAACGGDDAPSPAAFDLDGPLTGAAFFDAPFPADVRLDADGTLSYSGLPNFSGSALINQLRGRWPTPGSARR